MKPPGPSTRSAVAQSSARCRRRLTLSDRQFDKAIEIYKKVLADNPDFGAAHMGLAIAYWGAHKYPEAIQEFAIPQLNWRATRISSSLPPPWTRASALADGRARLRKAIEVSLAQRKSKTASTFLLTESRSYTPI
jgi:tetratricopeptide (TPR) repeat protein